MVVLELVKSSRAGHGRAGAAAHGGAVPKPRKSRKRGGKLKMVVLELVKRAGPDRTGRPRRGQGSRAGQGRAGQAKYFDSGMVHLIACAEQWDALAWAAMEGLGLAGARAPIAQLSRSSLTHF